MTPAEKEDRYKTCLSAAYCFAPLAVPAIAGVAVYFLVPHIGGWAFAIIPCLVFPISFLLNRNKVPSFQTAQRLGEDESESDNTYVDDRYGRYAPDDVEEIYEWPTKPS